MSLTRDRRNLWSESDKGARKTIPRRQRIVNRANRRVDRYLLSPALGADGADPELVDDRVAGRRRKTWRKWPDVPLGEYLAHQLQRREKRYGRKKR